MKYLTVPIIYLKNSDFDKKGNLIDPNIQKDKIVIIMIQANYCGYCTIAKPDFQEFANEISNNNSKYICATIQGDGNDKKLAKRISKIYPNFQGYPSYIVYKDGKYLQDYQGERDKKSLKKFAESL